MNQNKINSMEAVGELPDFGNLLLREGGYPHLPSAEWNPKGTYPKTAGVYQTRINSSDDGVWFQYWTGEYWDYCAESVEDAWHCLGKSVNQKNEWREVQR